MPHLIADDIFEGMDGVGTEVGPRLDRMTE